MNTILPCTTSRTMRFDAGCTSSQRPHKIRLPTDTHQRDHACAQYVSCIPSRICSSLCSTKKTLQAVIYPHKGRLRQDTFHHVGLQQRPRLVDRVRVRSKYLGG